MTAEKSVAADDEKFLGRWKSGRVWKDAANRASNKTISRGVGLKSWKQKVSERTIASLAKARKKEALEELQVRKAQSAKTRALNRKRKEENVKKTVVTQTITNSKKLKRMSKKQLKSLTFKN